MPDTHLAHLDDPALVDARAAWEAHVTAHRQCREAGSHRRACPEGQRLHEAMVLTAQVAYRSAHPEAFAPEPIE